MKIKVCILRKTQVLVSLEQAYITIFIYYNFRCVWEDRVGPTPDTVMPLSTQ